jgi:hypothetical protein
MLSQLQDNPSLGYVHIGTAIGDERLALSNNKTRPLDVVGLK